MRAFVSSFTDSRGRESRYCRPCRIAWVGGRQTNLNDAAHEWNKRASRSSMSGALRYQKNNGLGR